MPAKVPARILIVDDEERNRKLLEVFVKADGYECLVADGGKSSIALARTERPDLILLDLMMPAMDGFDVVRSLKNTPGTADIPVVIVSSLDDVASRKRMLAAGADAFVIKPIDRWKLSECMAGLLATRSKDANA